jgi:hypothetical protein
MNVVDERELSERLGGVLDAITPSSAPVGAALRDGKLIRARRNVGITAALAVAAGFVVAMPALLHQPARPGATPVRPTVTVRQLCPSTRHGVQGSARQPELVAGRAAGLPAADLVAGRAAGLPAADLVAGRAGGLPAADLVAGRAGGLPAADLVAGRCAWLMP